MPATVSKLQRQPLIRPFCEKTHSVPYLSLYLNCNSNKKSDLFEISSICAILVTVSNPQLKRKIALFLKKTNLCHTCHCIQTATRGLIYHCDLSATVSKLQLWDQNVTVSLPQLCPIRNTLPYLSLCLYCNITELEAGGRPPQQHSAQGQSSSSPFFSYSIARMGIESLRVLYNISLYIYSYTIRHWYTYTFCNMRTHPTLTIHTFLFNAPGQHYSNFVLPLNV